MTFGCQHNYKGSNLPPPYKLYHLYSHKPQSSGVIHGVSTWDWFQDTPAPVDTQIQGCSSSLYKIGKYSKPSISADSASTDTEG